jgi:signal transduction histidine kinase
MNSCPSEGSTVAVDRETGFDVWERREDRLFAVLPYVMLGAAVLITVLQGDFARYGLALGVLSPAAALWTLWWITLHPQWEQRIGLMTVYYLGFLAVSAALVAEAPWYGIYAWIGYVHAFGLLRGRWRFAGVLATAVIVATSQIGGPPELTVAMLSTWVLVIVLNVGIAGAFTYIAFLTSMQNDKRKAALRALEEANAKLESALAENAGLHAQLLAQARDAGALDERQRLASEIHDTLAQGFTGIITQLQAAELARDDRLRWQRHLDTAAALARENLAEARRSVHAMSPQALDSAPLPDALQQFVDRWSEVRGVRAEFTTTGSARPMHPELEATLLRVTQEALSNVAKHADAARVGLTLSYMEDQVTLDVRDDGVGFAPDSLPHNGNSDGGFGLLGMRRRVQRLAGSLSVESEPGSGTAISASLPALEVVT